MEKKCRKCKKVKPLSEFYGHQKTKDGRHSYCKVCFLEYQKVWKKKTNPKYPNRSAEYAKRWRLKYPGKASEATRAWKEKNKAKRQAHHKLGHAIELGRMLKGVCEKCGSEKVDGHHDDYNKPLEVRWLCRKHHREIHK